MVDDHFLNFPAAYVEYQLLIRNFLHLTIVLLSMKSSMPRRKIDAFFSIHALDKTLFPFFPSKDVLSNLERWPLIFYFGNLRVLFLIPSRWLCDLVGRSNMKCRDKIWYDFWNSAQFCLSGCNSHLWTILICWTPYALTCWFLLWLTGCSLKVSISKTIIYVMSCFAEMGWPHYIL